MTNDQIADLENILTDYEKLTTNEIVIVTIDSIQPYTDIHLYATDLGDNWAIGKKEKNNGLIISVSKFWNHFKFNHIFTYLICQYFFCSIACRNR